MYGALSPEDVIDTDICYLQPLVGNTTVETTAGIHAVCTYSRDVCSEWKHIPAHSRHDHCCAVKMALL